MHDMSLGRPGLSAPATFAEAVRLDHSDRPCIGNVLTKPEPDILSGELAKSGVRLELNGQPQRRWNSWINQLYSVPVRFIV